MNTDNLAKHYDQLTPREHLIAILGAWARADNVEQQRLMDSAPRIGLEAPHHYGLAKALIDAAYYHLMTLLDLAVKYQKWWGLWGWHCLRDETQKDSGAVRGKRAAVAAKTEEVRLYSLARYHAFLLLTYFDGWKQFCAEMSIDAEVLLDDLPGWETVKLAETEARKAAYARDDVMMFLLSEAIAAQKNDTEELEIPPVPTVEGLAKEWHGFVDSRAEASSWTR